MCALSVPSEGLGLVPPEAFLTDVGRKLRTAQTLLDLNGRFGAAWRSA